MNHPDRVATTGRTCFGAWRNTSSGSAPQAAMAWATGRPLRSARRSPIAISCFSVNIQADGDLMYAPGVLWTAARHNIPLLTVILADIHAYLQSIPRPPDAKN